MAKGKSTKAPLVPGQSPAARKEAMKTAKYGAPAMSPAERKKMDRIPGQSPAARSEAGRKIAMEKQSAQASAKSAGMAKKYASKIHVVKSGDTLSGIAKKNNVTVMQLKKWNPTAAERGIFAGTKIKVTGPSFKKPNKMTAADRGRDKGVSGQMNKLRGMSSNRMYGGK